MKSASVSTRVTRQVIPPIASLSSTSSASLGSSSRYRIHSWGFISRLVSFHASWWRFVNHGPKNPEFLNGVHKLVKIHRLHDVRVHAELVAPHHVFFFMRRSEHHHRNHLELLIPLYLLQHLQSIDLGYF